MNNNAMIEDSLQKTGRFLDPPQLIIDKYQVEPF